MSQEQALREALQDLYDEQNGPPLVRRERQWRAAYDKAAAVLSRSTPAAPLWPFTMLAESYERMGRADDMLWCRIAAADLRSAIREAERPTPAALTNEQLFAEMTRRDSSWNAYGRSRESAVRLARDVIASMQQPDSRSEK